MGWTLSGALVDGTEGSGTVTPAVIRSDILLRPTAKVGRLPGRKARRLILLLAAAALITGLGLVLLSKPAPRWGALGTLDFVEYWSASRLMWGGGNPYDLAALQAEEQSVGWPYPYPLPMLNPPWTLALVAPIGLLPFGHAATLWLMVQIFVFLGGGIALWRYFTSGDRRPWVGLGLAMGFVPGLAALMFGQCTGWMVLGIVAFLWAEKERKDFLAGAALALLLVKPHVTFLFWLAALWWALRYRRTGVLAGWAATLTIASGIALAFTPRVFAQYLIMMIGPQQHWVTATIGAWLVEAFGWARSWVRLVPSVLGGLGLLVWLWCRRGPWSWREQASPLLLAAVITSAYGWQHDQYILLPVVVDMVSRARLFALGRRRMLLAVLALIELAVLVGLYISPTALYFIWHPLALAALYMWVIRHVEWTG